MSYTALLLAPWSLVVCLRAQDLGSWLGVIDHPNSDRKRHSKPTPLVGGLALMLPLLVACAFWVANGADGRMVLSFMVAAGGAFFLGLLDDRKPLRVSIRLNTAIVLVLIGLVCAPEFSITYFSFNFLSEIIPLHSLSVAFTILVVVGMMNATNMTDGMNGLVCGLCLVWTLLLLFYAPPQVAFILRLLAVCLFVTLTFNLRGKLFLGDSGAYLIGMTISLMTILTYNEANSIHGAGIGMLYAEIVVLWFIVPVLDCLRLIVSRLFKKQSPGKADYDHFHHRLKQALPEWGTLLCYWGLVAIPGLVAIVMPSLTPYLVLVVCGIYIGVLMRTSEGYSRQPTRATTKPAQIAGKSRARTVN